MNDVDIIIVCFLLLTIFTAFVTIKTKLKYWIKWLLIPVLLALGLFFFVNFPNIQGYAYETYPVGKFRLLAFRAENNNKVIELWIDELGNPKSRLYKIPYNKDVDKSLQDMIHGEKQGGDPVGQFTKGQIKEQGKGNGNGDAHGNTPGNGNQSNTNNLGDPNAVSLHIEDFPATPLPAKGHPND